ncbi:hypothetical protein BUALT_Bualt16G0073400 [Buddleja alternifolia]|uniref:F-box domain-containing protein n=1 Tax=Buddleja alternifolia TaxID=168488 RepID=A0AAV6WKG5_9LAMI|nr:hypothetical protein BUALT_Bualt16G0073400 [Buddleja alternifolia]
MNSSHEKQIKKSKHQNTKDEHNNYFDQLQLEIALDILSRLPITSLIQFSFVSRSLNSLSHHPNVANMHFSRNESSCLILHSDYPIQNQLHFLILSDEKILKFNIPFANSMPEFSIIGSCNGLLCLINTLFPESISMYNPFTRDYLELPKNFGSQDQIVAYGFGFNPVNNDYKVIKISYYTYKFYHHLARHFRAFKFYHNKQVSEVQIYSLSSNSWENKGVLAYRLEQWSSPGVLVNTRLHWVITYPDSNPGRPSGKWMSCHLTALDGCLCAAVPQPPGHGAFNIWVMKEYGVNESWTKDYSIGVYYPVSMISHQRERLRHIWRNMFGRKLVRVLCVMKSGEVVLEYRGGGLVSYDPNNGSFKELTFHGMPKIYQTIVHVGSLKSAVSPL